MAAQTKPAFSASRRRLMRMLRILAVGITLVIAAIISFCIWNPYLIDGKYYVDALTIDAHHDIVITAALSWECSQPVYFEINENRHRSKDYGVLGYTTDAPATLKFELLTTDSHDFVAIVEKSGPGVVLMFHDFRTGTTWPNDGPEATSDCEPADWDGYYARMNQLLARLQDGLHRRLVLRDEAPINDQSPRRRIY